MKKTDKSQKEEKPKETVYTIYNRHKQAEQEAYLQKKEEKENEKRAKEAELLKAFETELADTLPLLKASGIRYRATVANSDHRIYFWRSDSENEFSSIYADRHFQSKQWRIGAQYFAPERDATPLILYLAEKLPEPKPKVENPIVEYVEEHFPDAEPKSEPKPKTRADLEKLKADWLRDSGDWEIEKYEGFEEFWDEIAVFAERQHQKWNEEARERKAHSLRKALAFPAHPTATTLGITKREFFAAFALFGILANPHHFEQKGLDLVIDARQYGDAMLEEFIKRELDNK